MQTQKFILIFFSCFICFSLLSQYRKVVPTNFGPTKSQHPTNIEQVIKADFRPNDPSIKMIEEPRSNRNQAFPTGEIRTLQNSLPSNEVPQNNQRKEDITGIVPIIGERFEANEGTLSYPTDNNMAISDNGHIVSLDNSTIAFYKANGSNGTYLSDYEWIDFYGGLMGITTNFFDPRVIYDNDKDRFILVIANSRNPSTSQIVVSFSKSNNPTSPSDWHHYILDGNPNHNTLWFDYPSIGISEHDLFITGNMFTQCSQLPCQSCSDVFSGNRIIQIDKQNGYDGDSLLNKIDYTDILDADNQLAFTLYPATWGLSGYSGPGIYLVSVVYNGSDRVYWYDITGNLGSPVIDCNRYKITTPTYIKANNSTQAAVSGGGVSSDSLLVSGCKVLGAFYLSGKIHFVFNQAGANDSLSAISYNIIDLNVSPQTNTRHILDESSQNKSLTYPNIASFAANISDESVMIGFLRSGNLLYPQVAVVNFNNGSFTNTNQIPVVRSGDGPVDLVCDDPLNPCCKPNQERWGDYIGIQRRYNQKKVWMLGCYGFGANSNTWGVTYGWNGYIAEIGDGSIGVENNLFDKEILIYPNPTQNKVAVKLGEKLYTNFSISITDMSGRKIKSFSYRNNNETEFSLDLQGISQGIYSIIIENNQQIVFYEKLAVIY